MKLLLTLVVLAALAGVAHAQLRRDEARAHHELGKVQFAQGRYQEALAEFRRAYELAPVPELLYNIGHCEELLGDVPAAIASYEQYLAAQPNADDAPALQSHLAELRKTLPPQEPVPVPVPVPAPVPAPVAVTREPPPRSHRGLYIGLGVGGGVIVVGAVLLGVLLSRSSTAAPYGGNFNPSFAPINP